MAADANVRDALEAFFRDDEGGVLSAYLFGSVPEGRSHRESDLDLGVLLDRGRYPDRRSRFDARLRLSGRIAAIAAPRAADLVVLNDAPPTLARHIVTRGQSVHRADAAADHAFVRDALLRAADLDPFLRRMRGLKLAGLRR